MRSAPSLSFGASKTLVLWRVVVVVFIVSAAVFLPARLVFWTSVGGPLSNLPDGDLPAGEMALILTELLRPVWLPLVLAFLSGCVTLWAWTVLWHAGLVRWFFYSGRNDVRLAEVLSRGLFGWWRWARLGITSATALAVVNGGIVAAFLAFERRAVDLADDSGLNIVLEAGILLGFGSALLVWLTTLRAAWLLGESRRRSAVLAWFAGLWGTVRQPVRSLFTLVAWMAPGILAVAAPTILGWRFEMLREVVPSTVLGFIAGLVVAFCQVGLFLSFAPVTGSARDEGADQP